MNGRPADDAAFLVVDAPSASGRRLSVRLVVRNTGNNRWATPDGVALHVLGGEDVLHSFPVDDGLGRQDAPHRGIVRGEPVSFAFERDLSARPGLPEVAFSMGRPGALFGQRVAVPVQG